MWKLEKDFKNYVLKKLSKEGMDVQLLENGVINVGCPDCFVQANGFDTFIEFKNLKDVDLVPDTLVIPWRAGQQGWAYRYRHNHNIHGMSKCIWTFVGLSNSIILIRMDKIYKDDIIEHKKDESIYIIPNEQLSKFNIYKFLYHNTIVRNL